MADPGDIVTVVLTTLGVAKVVGAPAEAVGEVVKERIKKRLNRTLDKARGKAGGDPAVSDRVAFKVLNEAAFTDDDVTLEYLAGVMAGSSPDDDAGAAIVGQIGRLSATQLLFHYLVYRELRRLWPTDVPLNLHQQQEADRAGVRLTMQDLAEVMGVAALSHLASVIPALVREGLLSSTRYDFGMEGKVPEKPTDPMPGLSARVRPTAAGAELFLWGHGVKNVSATGFTGPHLELDLLDIKPTPDSSLLTPPALPSALDPT